MEKKNKDLDSDKRENYSAWNEFIRQWHSRYRNIAQNEEATILKKEEFTEKLTDFVEKIWNRKQEWFIGGFNDWVGKNINKIIGPFGEDNRNDNWILSTIFSKNFEWIFLTHCVNQQNSYRPLSFNNHSTTA